MIVSRFDPPYPYSRNRIITSCNAWNWTSGRCQSLPCESRTAMPIAPSRRGSKSWIKISVARLSPISCGALKGKLLEGADLNSGIHASAVIGRRPVLVARNIKARKFPSRWDGAGPSRRYSCSSICPPRNPFPVHIEPDTRSSPLLRWFSLIFHRRSTVETIAAYVARTVVNDSITGA